MHRFLKIFMIVSIYLFLSFYGIGADIIDGILAVVNSDVITQGELNEILIPIYIQYKSTYMNKELVQKLEEAHKNILYQLIEDKLIIQEARKQEITVDDKEVEERLNQIKSQFSTDEEFNEALKSQSLTIFDLKEKYEEQIMIRKLVNREVHSKIKIRPLEITRYYEEHKDEFVIPAQVKVQTILIRKDDEEAENEVDLKVKIKEVSKKLKEGADFSKLAREYSEDPSALNNGDMGYIEKGQMMEKIDSVLFSLKSGETSDVIETNVGYHIFKVTEIKEPSVKSFEEARLLIEDILFQERAKVRFNEWITDLKENAYISIK